MRGARLTAFNTFLLRHDDRGPKPSSQIWLVDWKKYKLPYCSLYVVSPDGNWPCKVGISTNPHKRLMTLQTSVWKPLQVVKCYWVKSVKEARELERQVHRRLSDDNVWLHGEWFDMRPKEAKDMIEFVSAVEGIEINEEIEDEEVIADLDYELRSVMNNDYLVARIDTTIHKTFSMEDLANVANEYRKDGKMLPAYAQRMLEDHEEAERARVLPSLRGRNT